ncbi:hypothetical protein BC792_10966 [Sphingobacterium allocomposti]|uniref:Uncharacterized protein n=1 Tax=Sphingobacterium allocomposti TaxID=415956 RepID=A0A5S5DIT5_9SPHI|nr:hypothetical protein BC792_10966 [Sphingobacterium composti Yoo et al. 2007 non Ten et al. 2007]
METNTTTVDIVRRYTALVYFSNWLALKHKSETMVATNNFLAYKGLQTDYVITIQINGKGNA